MSVRLVAVFLAAALLIVSPASAFDPRTTGVVVIHGKWGRPGDPNTVGPLAAALQAAGFIVDQPEMPWSGARVYDRGFDQSMDEIDAAVARLRNSGANKIVVAGHSLGGAAALHYDATGHAIDALVLIAPAPLPEGNVYRTRLAGDLAKAQEMVTSGHGDDTAQFTDLNSDNRSRSLRVKAAVFLSYNSGDGPAAMGPNVRQLGRAPVLWLAPRFDPLTPVLDRVVWPEVPTTAPATRIEVIADHMSAPGAGRDSIVAWLKSLP